MKGRLGHVQVSTFRLVLRLFKKALLDCARDFYFGLIRALGFAVQNQRLLSHVNRFLPSYLSWPSYHSLQVTVCQVLHLLTAQFFALESKSCRRTSLLQTLS